MSDRYFLRFPQSPHHSSLGKPIVLFSLVYGVTILYGSALFLLYWFVWHRAEGSSFLSPVRFFELIWVVGSGLSIGYAIWSFFHSNSMSNNLESEAMKLGRHLHLLETVLQTQLENPPERSKKASAHVDSRFDVGISEYVSLSERTETLSERYDVLLE